MRLILWELDLVLYHTINVLQELDIASVCPLWNYIFKIFRSKQFCHSHWEGYGFCAPYSLTGAHTGDIMGSFTYHGQRCYKGLLKLVRCSHRAKWHLREIERLGKGTEGKQTPWDGDPACGGTAKDNSRAGNPAPPRDQSSFQHRSRSVLAGFASTAATSLVP